MSAEEVAALLSDDDQEFLDDLVQDLKSEEGSAITNEGSVAQLEYILTKMNTEEFTKALNEWRPAKE